MVLTFLKLHQLWNEGVNIYTADKEIPYCESAVMLDYNRLLVKWKTSDELEEYDSNSDVFKDLHRQFTSSELSQEFLREVDDVDVFFEAENARVFKNGTNVIRWEVKNATEVNISGLGDVAAKGEQTITLLKDTVLVLKALNSTQTRSKTLSIHLIKELAIEYDLEFLNPASKEYSSLKKDNASHVYGVHGRHKIRLSWNIPEAEKVLVQPFGATKKSGTRHFMPSGIQKIRISAWVQEREKHLDIVVQEYPIDLLHDRFIEIEEEFLPSMQVTSVNYAQKLTEFLNQKNVLDTSASLQKIRDEAQERGEQLYKQFERIGFDKVYEVHDPQSLGEMTQNRLKSYFKRQAIGPENVGFNKELLSISKKILRGSQRSFVSFCFARQQTKTSLLSAQRLSSRNMRALEQLCFSLEYWRSSLVVMHSTRLLISCGFRFCLEYFGDS